MSEGLLRLDQRMAEERIQLKESYEQWRDHPFTELFLSYFSAMAQGCKEDAVRADATDRDKAAHYYNAYKIVETSPDAVWRQADGQVEMKFLLEKERHEHESNQAGVPEESYHGGGAYGV